MWTRTRNPILPLLLTAALLLAPSCIFSPKPSDDPPPPVRIDWPDMTGKDDVVKTVVLCHENPKVNESAVRYEGLLHSKYIFVLDDQDVEPGGETFLTRAYDIESTKWLFENETLLELAVTPETGGTWEEITELDGEPCENCWEGIRDYVIRAQIGDDETIYQASPGAASVTIIVAPNESDPTKWVIRAIYDNYTGI